MQPEPLTNPQPVSDSTDPVTADPNVAERIEAWTDQHPANVARPFADGQFYGDARRGPSAFRPAIRWMRRQMRERISGAVGHPPVWLTVTPSWNVGDFVTGAAWPRPMDLAPRCISRPAKPG
jgi:hypothetical protein